MIQNVAGTYLECNAGDGKNNSGEETTVSDEPVATPELSVSLGALVDERVHR